MNIKYRKSILALSMVALLSACADDNDDDDNDHVHDMATYEISVYNITANQPLTPVALIAHEKSYSPWELGMAASNGLEKLAESGDTTDFIAEADMNSMVETTATSTGGPIGPGNMATITVEVHEDADLQISLASMLANTNDAFTGVTNWTIGDLAVNESAVTMTHVFDAGTEENTEAAGTIPGPADSGTGYSSAREMLNKIVIHPGVVTMDDGLSTSVLNESHRWLATAAKVVVTRTQ